LDYILSDLWASAHEPSKGNGSRYLLTFIDNFSKNVWVYFLKEKSEVLKVYKEWKTLLENQTGKKINRLRTNNGLEFYNQQFDKFCKTKGIVRYKTMVNTPQQNEVTKRLNMSLLERAFVCFPMRVWVRNFRRKLSVQIATWWIDLLSFPLSARHPMRYGWVNRQITQTWKYFCCPVYFHVNKEKLEPIAKKDIFVGYSMNVNEYKLWCPNLSKFLISRDIIFDESAMLKAHGVAPSR
jgi:Integrase core domain